VSPHEVAFVGVAGLIGGVACVIGIGAIGITGVIGAIAVIGIGVAALIIGLSIIGRGEAKADHGPQRDARREAEAGWKPPPHLRDNRRDPSAMRKLIAFDDETFDKRRQLARDRMASFQELADEAFADLVKKHGVPIDLKDALRKSAARTSGGTKVIPLSKPKKPR
jgi:hypothetical protein